MIKAVSRRNVLRFAGIAGALTIAGLAGLGTAQKAYAGELELVKPGTLRVAYNGDMPGTSVKDGKLIGLDGEIMQWVGEQLGLKVEPVLMEWAAEIESVKSRRVDVMHGMMGWTEGRSKVISMTDPIYYVGVLLVQKKSSNLSTLADIEGKRIGTIQGFAHVEQLKQVPGTKLSFYDTSDAGMRDLMAGRIDALISDPPLVQYIISQNPQWDVHAIPINEPYDEKFSLLTGKFDIVFGLSQQAPNLLAAFNEKIAEAWAHCINAKAAAKYGLGDASWLEPGQVNVRAGKDRSADWKQPVPPDACKS